jgi:hypothetical protein
MMDNKIKYTNISIESTVDGYIVREKGKDVRIFALWWRLEEYIKSRLSTTHGEA